MVELFYHRKIKEAKRMKKKLLYLLQAYV